MYQFNTHNEYPDKITRAGGTINSINEKILEQPHTLIAGATGSGKSVMLNGIIYTIMALDAGQMILCDPKMVELRMYKDSYNCRIFADTAADIKHALEYAHDEMMRRYEELSRSGKREIEGNHIYVIVDEFADLIMDKENGKKIVDLLQSLAQLGRAAHVHTVLATQAPSRKVLKAEITLNMTCRVALRCDSAIESRQIIGETGAELLPRYGECIMKTPGEIIHYRGVQLYTEEELQQKIDFYTAQVEVKQPARRGFHLFGRRSVA